MIISTTLTHSCANIIGDALRSVHWVDKCIVIDTGLQDDTLKVARTIVGDRLIVRTYDWNGNFSDARNFALQAAQEAGATWAVTLDTDERLYDCANVRTVIETTRDDVLLVASADGHYAKERFIRLPTAGHWVGPVHEAFFGKVKRAVLDGCAFTEVKKTEAQLREKYVRDVQQLLLYLDEHQMEPRWHFYLGESFKNLGQLEQALIFYDNCSRLHGWNEEAAWACFRAGECLCLLERYQEAIERCAQGMTHHAGVPELAWLAGFCNYKLNNWQQAALWCRISQAQAKNAPRRLGFRHPFALNEGPWDILRFALKQLGDAAGAAAAELGYAAAVKKRSEGRS